MNLTVGIVSWKGFDEKALKIALDCSRVASKTVVVHSTGNLSSQISSVKWIEVSENLYFGAKFEVILAEVESEILLLIQADADCEDWAGLCRRCKRCFEVIENLVVWSPELTGTPWTTERVRLGDLGGGLTAVAQTDAIVLGMRRPVLSRLKEYDYSSNNLGWGIDWAAVCYCYSVNALVLRDSAFTVNHKLGSGYAHSDARAQMNTFLSQMTDEEVICYNRLLKFIGLDSTPTLLPSVIPNVGIGLDEPTPSILYIDPNIPSLNTDTGSEHSFHYIAILRALGYKIDYLPLQVRKNFLGYAKTLIEMGVTVLDTRTTNSEQVFSWLETNYQNYKIIIASRPEVGEQIVRRIPKRMKHERYPYVIYNIVDFHYERMYRQSALANSQVGKDAAQKMRITESEILMNVDGAIFLSDREEQIAESLGFAQAPFRWGGPSVTRGVPQIVRPRFRVVFLGSFGHQPNVDGIAWFVAEIWPTISTKFPHLHLDIIGDGFEHIFGDSSEIPRLKAHGFVEDLSNLFDSAICSIAPLRFGAGIKGKIITSFSFGVPVICTAIAAEGFDNIPESLILQSTEDFDVDFVCQGLVNLSAAADAGTEIHQATLLYFAQHFDVRCLLWKVAYSIATFMPGARTETVKQMEFIMNDGLDLHTRFISVMEIAIALSKTKGVTYATDFLDTVLQNIFIQRSHPKQLYKCKETQRLIPPIYMPEKSYCVERRTHASSQNG